MTVAREHRLWAEHPRREARPTIAGRSTRPPASSISRTISTVFPGSCRAASASAWPWGGRSCANRRCSCSTSRCPTSMPTPGADAGRDQDAAPGSGTTIVYVTHDQVEAMTMADRIVVMNAGQIEQVGSPLDLYDRPGHRFVGSFLGSPAMSFVPGRRRTPRWRPSSVQPPTKVSRSATLPEAWRGRPGTASRSTSACAPNISGSPRGPNGMPFPVEVVEPTGAETHLVGTVEGAPVRCVFRERLKVCPAKPCLFSPTRPHRVLSVDEVAAAPAAAIASRCEDIETCRVSDESSLPRASLRSQGPVVPLDGGRAAAQQPARAQGVLRSQQRGRGRGHRLRRGRRGTGPTSR